MTNHRNVSVYERLGVKIDKFHHEVNDQTLLARGELGLHVGPLATRVIYGVPSDLADP